MQNLSYHQRLNALRLYSLQRRLDRYIVIYMWKILENLVPNLIPNVQLLSGEAGYAIHSMFPLDILDLYVLTVLDRKPQDCLTHCLLI